LKIVKQSKTELEKVKKAKTITRIIEGHKFVFKRTRHITQLLDGVHYSHLWSWSIDGEEFGTARTTSSIRRQIPYNLMK